MSGPLIVCEDVPALMPLLNAAEFEGMVLACWIPRPDAAFAFKPRVMMALDVITDPLGWRDVEVWIVTSEVDEDDGYSVLDDGAVSVELPG